MPAILFVGAGSGLASALPSGSALPDLMVDGPVSPDQAIGMIARRIFDLVICDHTVDPSEVVMVVAKMRAARRREPVLVISSALRDEAGDDTGARAALQALGVQSFAEPAASSTDLAILIADALHRGAPSGAG